MKKLTRSIIQICFWGVVWVIIVMNQRDYLNFFTENLPSYVFQIVLIFLTIYYLAPKLFFKQKYYTFIIIILVSIFAFSFISSQLIRMGNDLNVPSLSNFSYRRPPRRPPSAFFIHSLLLSIAFTLAIVIEIFLFAKKKEEALIISKAEALETELKLLKSQINPHFLFNTLNNIYALSAIDTEKTQKGISYLSDMLRYVLYECELPLVAIRKEVSYIKDYINLFELKSNKKYPIQTNFNIQNQDFKIAPMLFIPFLENAFKHSNIEQINKSFIKIIITTTEDEAFFSVENSKPTIPNTSTNKSGGIGIKNVKKRLSILYREAHSLEINETNTRFKIILTLKKE